MGKPGILEAQLPETFSIQPLRWNSILFRSRYFKFDCFAWILNSGHVPSVLSMQARLLSSNPATCNRINLLDLCMRLAELKAEEPRATTPKEAWCSFVQKLHPGWEHLGLKGWQSCHMVKVRWWSTEDLVWRGRTLSDGEVGAFFLAYCVECRHEYCEGYIGLPDSL